MIYSSINFSAGITEIFCQNKASYKMIWCHVRGLDTKFHAGCYAYQGDDIDSFSPRLVWQQNGGRVNNSYRNHNSSALLLHSTYRWLEDTKLFYLTWYSLVDKCRSFAERCRFLLQGRKKSNKRDNYIRFGGHWKGMWWCILTDTGLQLVSLIFTHSLSYTCNVTATCCSTVVTNPWPADPVGK